MVPSNYSSLRSRWFLKTIFPDFGVSKLFDLKSYLIPQRPLPLAYGFHGPFLTIMVPSNYSSLRSRWFLKTIFPDFGVFKLFDLKSYLIPQRPLPLAYGFCRPFLTLSHDNCLPKPLVSPLPCRILL